MPPITQYAPGTFCWADLTTVDADLAKDFYTRLFGWTCLDVPADQEGVYTMFQKDGKNVCAVYAMDDETRQQGVPPHWTSYISVTDADRAADKAQQLGGTVLAPAFDVMHVGRMAAIQDPTGAVVFLWEPKAHIGAEIVGEPNALCWHELQTYDTEAAEAFYTGLFGWTATTETNALGIPYTEFSNRQGAVAGMLSIGPEWGDVPPNWGVYFAVDDCDAALGRAEAAGGSVVVPAMDIPKVGRFAVLRDRQGAHFSVIRLTAGP